MRQHAVPACRPKSGLPCVRLAQPSAMCWPPACKGVEHDTAEGAATSANNTALLPMLGPNNMKAAWCQFPKPKNSVSI